MPAHRRYLAAALVGVAVLFGWPDLARAEDGYRFWGYYTWTTQAWAFAASDAARAEPADGDVEGWRYAVSGNTPRLPRTNGDFDRICAGVPAEDGKKRVAVVIDYGTDEDAPEGEPPPSATGTCVVADPDASGLDLLRAVTEVRTESATVCGVNGFPESGCGAPVADISVSIDEDPIDLVITEPVGSQRWDPTAAPTPTRATRPPDDQPAPPDDSWRTWAVGGGLLLAISATGFVLTRRRARHR